MEIDSVILAEIHDSLCDRLRHSATQSNRQIESTAARLAAKPSGHPEYSASLHVVASAALGRTDPTSALRSLDRIDRWRESDATANYLAGLATLALDDLPEAARRLRHAVDLDPSMASGWFYLGRIAEEEKAADRAINHFRRGIFFETAPHRCAIALSQLYHRRRQLGDAIHTLRVSLIRDRRSAELNAALARLLERRAFKLGRRRRHVLQDRVLAEALECYRIVNQVRPRCASLVAQGRLELSQHQSVAAKRSFEKAVQKDPDSANALRHLANVQLDFGKLDLAVSQFEQSLKIAPERAESHFRYTRAKRFRGGRTTREYLQTLNELLTSTGGGKQKQIYLNFALAKVYDDLGDYDRAWNHYEQANDLKRRPDPGTTGGGSRPRRRNLGGSSMEELVAHSLDRCDASFLHRHRLARQDRRPIFIVGIPRSGTTLTEQILSSHPDVAGAGELNLIHRIRQQISRSVPRPESSDFDPNSLYQHIAETNPVELQHLADGYLSKLEQFGNGERHVTDKMPTNFMYLGLIATLFPGATVIHCRRNPMDVLVSCFCQNLNPPFCDPQQMVTYYRNYRRLMDHWRRVLPIQIYDSDYESLVANPEESARTMIEHCGLPWSDECLQFRDNARAVRTPSKWQVRQPIYRSSVAKWKRFEKYLRPIADQIESDVRLAAPLAIAGQVRDVAVTR